MPRPRDRQPGPYAGSSIPLLLLLLRKWGRRNSVAHRPTGSGARLVRRFAQGKASAGRDVLRSSVIPEQGGRRLQMQLARTTDLCADRKRDSAGAILKFRGRNGLD